MNVYTRHINAYVAMVEYLRTPAGKQEKFYTHIHRDIAEPLGVGPYIIVCRWVKVVKGQGAGTGSLFNGLIPVEPYHYRGGQEDDKKKRS